MVQLSKIKTSTLTFLIKRNEDDEQLSMDNYQYTTIDEQLLINKYQRTTIIGQLSIDNYYWTIIN